MRIFWQWWARLLALSTASGKIKVKEFYLGQEKAAAVSEKGDWAVRGLTFEVQDKSFKSEVCTCLHWHLTRGLNFKSGAKCEGCRRRAVPLIEFFVDGRVGWNMELLVQTEVIHFINAMTSPTVQPLTFHPIRDVIFLTSSSPSLWETRTSLSSSLNVSLKNSNFFLSQPLFEKLEPLSLLTSLWKMVTSPSLNLYQQFSNLSSRSTSLWPFWER